MDSQAIEQKTDKPLECQCYCCNETFESPIEFEGKEIICPNCKELIIVQKRILDVMKTESRPQHQPTLDVGIELPQSYTVSWRILADFIRWVLIIGASFTAVLWLWNIHWLLAIFLAIPVFVLSVNLFGFLTLPIYGILCLLAMHVFPSMLTPEEQLAQEMWKKLKKRTNK